MACAGVVPEAGRLMLSAEKRFVEVIPPPPPEVTLRGTEESHAESEVAVVMGFLGFSQPPASRRDGAAGAGAGSLSCSEEEESCGSWAERTAASEASLDVSGWAGGAVVGGVELIDGGWQG